MNARPTARIVLLPGALWCLTAAAMAPDAADALRRSCDAYAVAADSAEGAACRAYVDGFLAGARLQGARPPSRQAPAGETWQERATRTRLGRLRQDALRAADPGFCLPEALPLDPLVTAFQRELQAPDRGAAHTPAELLTALLRRLYPCPD